MLKSASVTMLIPKIILQCALLGSILMSPSAFTSVQIRRDETSVQSFFSRSRCAVASLPLQDRTSIKQIEMGRGENSEGSSLISQQIKELTEKGEIEASMQLLKDSTATNYENFSSEGLYQTVVGALAARRLPEAPQLADELYQTIVGSGYHPSSKVVNSIIAIWSKSSKENAADICIRYIRLLWSKHDETGDEDFVPMRSSYTSAVAALSKRKSRPGRENAEQAEALLEEMEKRRTNYPRLSPNTITVNAVLNTWSKSRLWHGGARRSEQILERMIYLGKDRPELRPDTTSFNTVLDTLAKSLENDREERAEALLEKMEELSESDASLNCRPNEVSFNVVINCWAQSRQRGSARRATAILRHMAKRYESDTSDVCPDSATYTTTINAWARSREIDAVERAEEILEMCEESFKLGNIHAKPNTLTYNSMINCYSKSRLGASDKALAMLQSMKERSQAGAEWCSPDVVTYTSVIDTLAKEQTAEATEMAETLLEELEKANLESPDHERLKPNIRTYTSAINAIGRSGKNPEKAEVILERLEKLADEGNKAFAPDVVCYNAVLNAYGWSQVPGKASKCFSILQRMISRSESGRSYLSRPDIITCNSVLNACAFDKTKTDTEKGDIIKIVVDTLETFQKAIPRYGYPDHVTYSQVLYAISNQMESGEEQHALAEATFWQCCQAGQVNAKVVNALEQVLPWSRFSALMGSALRSQDGEKASFNLSLFPRTWTRHAVKQKAGGNSRASRKRDRGYKVTNQAMNKLSDKSQ